MQAEHGPIPRCGKCIQAREKCPECRFKCKCGWPFKEVNKHPVTIFFFFLLQLTFDQITEYKNLKQSFRNHLKQSGKDEPNGSARSQLLHSVEYITKCFNTKCCTSYCLRAWTFNDLQAMVKKHANLTNNEKDEVIIEYLKGLQMLVFTL